MYYLLFSIEALRNTVIRCYIFCILQEILLQGSLHNLPHGNATAEMWLPLYPTREFWTLGASSRKGTFVHAPTAAMSQLGPAPTWTSTCNSKLIYKIGLGPAKTLPPKLPPPQTRFIILPAPSSPCFALLTLPDSNPSLVGSYLLQKAFSICEDVDQSFIAVARPHMLYSHICDSHKACWHNS